MKGGALRIYYLHTKVLIWERTKLTKQIINFILKSRYTTTTQKLALRTKIWNQHRIKGIASQTNVCRRGGNYKRVLNLIGFNRHAIRQLLNVDHLPNLKKLHW